MTLHVKQGGAVKEVKPFFVKQGGVAKEIQEGWVKQGGVVKKFYEKAPPAPPISPTEWIAQYLLPGPWQVDAGFVASGPGPYVWAWQESSSQGGAQMVLLSGQGTNTAQFRATCPGTESAGGGDLIGEIVCSGAVIPVAIIFGSDV